MGPSGATAASDLPSTPVLFLRLSTQRPTVVRAVKVACVITPILTVMNHYHEIVAFDMGPQFWFQVALTFSVPYCVSTYSSAMTALAALREAQGSSE